MIINFSHLEGNIILSRTSGWRSYQWGWSTVTGEEPLFDTFFSDFPSPCILSGIALISCQIYDEPV